MYTGTVPVRPVGLAAEVSGQSSECEMNAESILVMPLQSRLHLTWSLFTPVRLHRPSSLDCRAQRRRR
ncbi:unnamed protein product [Merluccius merluccius]